MSKPIHSFLRFVTIAACLGIIPLTAIICRSISRLASDGYVAYLGGRPLPDLTQAWIIGQAQSWIYVWIAAAISLFLGFWAITAQQTPDGAPRKLTIFLLILGTAQCLSFLHFASTLIAAFLPLIGDPLR
jgi:hypothetical protein